MATIGPDVNDDDFESFLLRTYTTNGADRLFVFDEIEPLESVEGLKDNALQSDQAKVTSITQSTTNSSEESSALSIGETSREVSTRKSAEESPEESMHESSSYSSEEYKPKQQYKKKTLKAPTISSTAANNLVKPKPKRKKRLIPSDIKRLQAELAEYQTQLSNLTPPTDLVGKAKSDWARKEKNKISAQITRHNKVINELQSKLKTEQLQKEREDLVKQVLQLKNDNAYLTGKLAAFKSISSPSSVKAASEAPPSAKSCLEAESQALMIKNDELEKIINALKRSNGKDSQDLETQKSLNEALQAKVNHLESQLLMLKEQNTKINHDLSSNMENTQEVEQLQQSKLKVLQTEKSVLQALYQMLTNCYNQLNEKFTRKQAHDDSVIQDQRIQIEKLLWQKSYLESRLAELKDILERQEQVKNQQIHELQRMVDDLQTDLNYLEHYQSTSQVPSSRDNMRAPSNNREHVNPPILHVHSQQSRNSVPQPRSKSQQDYPSTPNRSRSYRNSQ